LKEKYISCVIYENGIIDTII